MGNRNDIQFFDALSVIPEGSNLIEASAGTGKTYSIAILALRLVLEKKIPLPQVLMVTFTKASVAELETRIRQFMRNALRVSQGIPVEDETITAIVSTSMNNGYDGPLETERLLKEAVLFLDETSILTIHSFCQRVLTEFAFETRQVFGSEILTDLQAVITDRVNDFWRKHITTINSGVLQELIEAGLSRSTMVKVIENALSGKAHIRLGELPAGFLSASHQLNLSGSIDEFNNKITLIKSSVLDYISSNIDAIRSATEKNNHAKRNMGRLLDDPELFLDAIIENSDKAYVQKLYQLILSDCDRMLAVEKDKINTVKIVINQVYNLAVQNISTEVSLYKQQHNQLSFDDMVSKLHQAILVDNNETLVSALKAKYKAAFIDEFQDTDKMQYEIFSKLFSGETILFYIGDPKQSIYSWRKADIFTYFKAADEVMNRFGMNVNYRSSKRFIEGMNHFFLPASGFDTFYFSEEADKIPYLDVEFPATSIKGELYRRGQPDEPITIFENSNNESISAAVAAQIVQLLGSDDYTIEVKGEHRPLRPSDIGILVRKNSQAGLIKQLLSKFGIPAVTIDDTKLLQSPEARHILYLLQAVADIDAAAINKALLSPLTRLDTADILKMDDELPLNLFKGYQHLWENEGVYVMLSAFISDYKVKQALLDEKVENGERVLTNVLQLTELLHKIQTQKQFSMAELINWLQRGIEGMPVEGDEFEQRVESDEEAVKIVTIHKSKGLEYNVVFAPFLDLLSSSSHEFVIFRDDESGDYIFAEGSLLSDYQLRLYEKQLEQENRRLLYVAVTRAVYKCYINRNTNHRYATSSLAPFISALKQAANPLIAFEVSPELPAGFRYGSSRQPLMPVYLQAPDFQLTQVNWRKLSYTYLDAGHVAGFKTSYTREMESYDDFIFSALRRGAHTGNFLHFIFERVDFADATNWEAVITEALKRFMFNPPAGYPVMLLKMLQHVTQVLIRVDVESFSLQQLHRGKRINEMEFDFNVMPFRPDEVNRLSTPEVPIQIRYAKELEGIMNGKIDMFFEYGDKYFILDWKSNFLGNRQADYSQENIRLAMTESNYHLQYLIYTLALTKYLRLKIPGFSYAKHFGGVIYLFVRGVRQNSDHGIFAYKPSAHLIDRMDELLSTNTDEAKAEFYDA